MINQKHALREKKSNQRLSKLRKIRAQLTEVNQKNKEVQKEYIMVWGPEIAFWNNVLKIQKIKTSGVK